MFSILKSVPRLFSVYKWQTAFLLFVLLLELTFDTLLPLSLKFIVDNAITPRNFEMLIVIIGGLLGFFLLTTLSGFLHDKVFASVSARITQTLYHRLYSHLQGMQIDYFAKRGVNNIMTRFTTDLVAVEQLIIMLPSILLAVLGMLLNFIVLFILQWQLALVALIGLPICVIGTKLFGKKAFQSNYDYKYFHEEMMVYIHENLNTQSVIKAFALQNELNGQFNGSMRQFQKIAARSTYYSTLVDRTTNVASILLNLLIIAIGSYLAYENYLSIGSLIAFSTLMLTISYLVEDLIFFVPQIMQASASNTRLEEIYKEPISQRGGTIQPSFEQELTLQNVSFGYSPPALDLHNVTMTIPFNSYVAFVGESGSGKSTLVHLLTRFHTPQHGTIFIDGTDFNMLDEASYLQHVGVVFQETLLFNRTIHENILVGNLNASEEDMIQAAKAAEIHDLILSLPQGYDTLAGERGSRLTSGQRQRIGLARALIRKPRLLILDEVTTALDPATESSINQTIENLANDMAIISVSYRLTAVQQAHHTYVFKDGAVAEHGTHQQLVSIQDGLYAKMWDKQTAFQLSADGSETIIPVQKLKSIPLFRELTPAMLEKIAPLFISESYPANTIVFEQGDIGSKFYIIVRGAVDVVIGEAVVNHLVDGDFLGEIALLQNIPRTATIKTTAPTMFITLNQQAFNVIIGEHPQLKEQLVNAWGVK